MPKKSNASYPESSNPNEVPQSVVANFNLLFFQKPYSASISSLPNNSLFSDSAEINNDFSKANATAPGRR